MNDTSKVPKAAEGYYLGKLIKQLFGGESTTGTNAFHTHLTAELEALGKHNFIPAVSTVGRWCENRGLTSGRSLYQRQVAAAVLVAKLPEEERPEVTAQLLGEAELPQSIQEEYAVLVGREKGETYQNAGPLISSAVRAWTGLFGVPSDSEEYARSNDDLVALKHMFRDHLSIREFALAASQLFHRNTDPEFRLNVFTYAVGQLSERTDFSPDLAEGRWDGEFVRSGRAFLRAAWAAKIHRTGSDNDLQLAATHFETWLSKAMSGRREAPLYALACCVICQTSHPYPIGIAPTDEQVEKLLDYTRGANHEPLVLRTALLLSSKTFSFNEYATSRFVMDHLAANADLDIPRQHRKLGSLWLPPMSEAEKTFGYLTALVENHQSWIIRYPILSFAYRNNLRITGLEAVATEVLQDMEASDETRREATCYLARVADQQCQSILIQIALSDARDKHRAVTAICASGSPSAIRLLLANLPCELEYERRALLDAMSMQLPVASKWEVLKTWTQLNARDRRYIRNKGKAIREFIFENGTTLVKQIDLSGEP